MAISSISSPRAMAALTAERICGAQTEDLMHGWHTLLPWSWDGSVRDDDGMRLKKRRFILFQMLMHPGRMTPDSRSAGPLARVRLRRQARRSNARQHPGSCLSIPDLHPVRHLLLLTPFERPAFASFWKLAGWMHGGVTDTADDELFRPLAVSCRTRAGCALCSIHPIMHYKE
jgi:hypothetical protein